MSANIEVMTFNINLNKEVKMNESTAFEVKIDYPEFISNKERPPLRRINSYYSANANTFYKKMDNLILKSALDDNRIRAKSGEEPMKYEAAQKYEVTYHENCLLSVVTESYEFTGGAHGNSVKSSASWNTDNGSRVSLKMLFPNNPKYFSVIKSNIIKQIEEQISQNNSEYFEDYSNLVNKYFNPNSFYILPGYLVFYFQNYEISPYSFGMPEFKISVEDLGATLPKCRT